MLSPKGLSTMEQQGWIEVKWENIQAAFDKKLLESGLDVNGVRCFVSF